MNDTKLLKQNRILKVKQSCIFEPIQLAMSVVKNITNLLAGRNSVGENRVFETFTNTDNSALRFQKNPLCFENVLMGVIELFNFSI